METPDFEVRNLADYSVKDLQYLKIACEQTKSMILRTESDAIQSIDIWCYRIKDALSQAKKRESDN